MIVKMMIATFNIRLRHSCVAHRADQLPCHDWIAHTHESPVRVQKLMRKTIGVPDRDSADGAFASICHDTVYRRTQRRMLQIDSPLPIRADVVIFVYALMR